MDSHAPLPCSLRQLQYLVAVADFGGFGRAAAQCHVSQPSLSAQVALVEEALGVRVFERDRRSVRVSAAGAPVLEAARHALVAAREVVAVAGQQADPFIGVVRIGIIPTACPYLLPLITPALRKKYPGLTVVWSEEQTSSLIARVADGQLDAAIAAEGRDTAGLESVELGRDPFVLAASPGHPLMRSRGPVNPTALRSVSVLLLEDGHCLRDQALALCARAGAGEAEYRATSLSTLVQMVVNSDGVTVLPSLALAVENRGRQLATRQFTAPAPARTLVLVWRRSSARRRTFEGIGATVRDAYRKK